MKFVFGLFLILVSGLGLSVENEPLITKERSDSFLKVLLGNWDGEALETPVGKINYDIHFYECRNGSSAGVADTGASRHYWYFIGEDRKLRLRFLSTFSGNRQPVLLVPIKLEKNTLHFAAPKLELLTLTIEAADDLIDIRIFHYKKPHVHIHLRRLDTHASSDKQHESFCQALPKSLLR